MGSYENTVFNKDVIDVVKSLPDNSVDMIYSDPDYNVGIKYNDKSYTMSFEKYIEWYIELAENSFRVLKDSGNMFFINYPKQNAHLRVKCLDDICYDINEYVWIYNTNVGHSPKKFTRAHRSILHCRKSKSNKWFKDNVAEPYKNPTDKRILNNIKNGSKGRMPYSWLYYDLVKNVSKDKTIHACQIPLGLFKKLLLASTEKGDIVFVHFGGSGNEIDFARKSGRRFVSAEIDEVYYNLIKHRLENDGAIPDEYRLKTQIRPNSSELSLF